MYISVGKYRKRSLIIIYIDHRNASYRRTTDIYIEILNLSFFLIKLQIYKTLKL